MFMLMGDEDREELGSEVLRGGEEPEESDVGLVEVDVCGLGSAVPAIGGEKSMRK